MTKKTFSSVFFCGYKKENPLYSDCLMQTE